jgi:hypothetical protein
MMFFPWQRRQVLKGSNSSVAGASRRPAITEGISAAQIAVGTRTSILRGSFFLARSGARLLSIYS